MISLVLENTLALITAKNIPASMASSRNNSMASRLGMAARYMGDFLNFDRYS
jgi:hypothetical protein